jgi:hypothetical protein
LAGKCAWQSRESVFPPKAGEPKFLHAKAQRDGWWQPPVANFLSGYWGKEVVAKRLQDILQRLRAEAPLTPGHAAANILHLLLQLRVNPRGYNFSRLVVWQADLRESRLPQVNFSQADLTHSAFVEPFETIRALAFSPDGLRLVGGAYNGNLHVWRLVDH